MGRGRELHPSYLEHLYNSEPASKKKGRTPWPGLLVF